MLSKWPIRNKLLIGLGLLLVIVATLSGGGFYAVYAYRSLVKGLSSRVAELPRATEFGRRVGDLRVTVSDSQVLLETSDWDPFSGVEQHGPRVAGQLLRGEFRTNLERLRQALERYRQQLRESDDRSGRIGDGQQEWQTVSRIETVLSRIEENSLREFGEVKTDQLNRDLEQLQQLAVELPSYLHANVQDLAGDVRGQYHTLIWIHALATLAAAGLLTLLVRLFYQWVFRPLRILVKGSRRVAMGQFSLRIHLDTRDEMSELADAMNQMTSRFQAIRDDLDRQVKERTKQVVRSEQLASVGFLAAGVAHEINNPLASIALCAESLEGRMHDVLSDGNAEHAVVGQYLRMIQTEAFRCKEITEKLLDFSRLGEFQRQDTDLRELVQGVIDMVGHVGKYQEKQIAFAPGPNLMALVNAQELKQVVLNLLTNGLESLDRGGVVQVELQAQADQAEITFTDNGCGMTPEVMEHLFEPFFTRRRGGQGTGLGLSITYRIVADHDGQIEVSSDGPGRGSRFCVRLPLEVKQKETQHRYQAA